MSSLGQRLHLGVQQKQILTPGLVQMVTVLQLNRLELKDMIINEIAENPVLEEAKDGTEELTPEEVHSLLERERAAEPADQAILQNTEGFSGCGGCRRGACGSTCGGAGIASSRSVRRNRFRQLFRRLPRPGIQESGGRVHRETFL